MTIDFERLLRDTVQELAAEGRPVDLTAPALRTARRIRTRRNVSMTALAIVLLVGLGFPVIQFRGGDEHVPPAERSPAPSATASPSPAPSESVQAGSAPVSLPGGWLIRAAPAVLGSVVYDDRLGRYRVVAGADRVAPSPNGRFLAQVTGNGELVLKRAEDEQEIRRRGAAILDRAVYPVWAPDSSKVAFVITTGQGTRLVAMNLDGTEQLSASNVPCANGCTVKWLDNGRLRLYTASSRVEVTVATGAVGVPSATPDDPCGHRFAGYQIDNTSWLCVTATGFAVTARNGSVSQRVAFPTTLDDVGVGDNINGYVLFRPK